jgi:hypothetical protein
MENNSEYVYNYVLNSLVNDADFVNNQQIHYHNDSEKVAIIIDPRFDKLMEAVIRNFMHFMNPHGWNLLIVSYSGYESEIQKLFPNCIFYKIPDEYIYMDEKNIPNITIETYNNIMCDKHFWESIPYNHIAIFQKDCIMFKMFEDYFSSIFDYSGANYYHGNHIAYYYGGINGGFSLRNKQTMIECLEKVSWEDINAYRLNTIQKNPLINNQTDHIIDTINEDVFFTYACEILFKRVPDVVHRSFLAIESNKNINTCVYHGWNKNFHNIEFALAILLHSELFKKYLIPVNA